MIAGGGRSGRVEQPLNEAAKLVSDGHINSVDQLTKQLENVVPTDPEFEVAFATVRVSKNILVRYYLRAMELKQQGNPEPEWIPNTDPVVNLEHILPDNPGHDWPAFNEAMVSVYYNRLGNMLLLRASTNSKIGNRRFAEKRSAFRESTFALTQDVSGKKTWGPEDIEDRQKRLAKLAVETWPLTGI